MEITVMCMITNVMKKIDLRFCKILLGVHRKATNTAVRGALGTYPISLHILKQVLKYWMRMSRGNRNPVLHACYLHPEKIL